MKISNSLLKAILLGVTIGTVSTSCSSLKDKNEVDIATCDENCAENCTEQHTTKSIHSGSCPACGMG